MLHIKSIRPMFTSIITTAEKFKEDYMQDGIIMASKGDYKPWQTVVSVGDSVRGIKPGDKVMVNFENYVIRRYDKNSIQNDLDNNRKVRYAFNFVNMDDKDGNPKEHFLFNDRDVLYAFEGVETNERKIVVPRTQLIGIS